MFYFLTRILFSPRMHSWHATVKGNVINICKNISQVLEVINCDLSVGISEILPLYFFNAQHLFLTITRLFYSYACNPSVWQMIPASKTEINQFSKSAKFVGDVGPPLNQGWLFFTNRSSNYEKLFFFYSIILQCF